MIRIVSRVKQDIYWWRFITATGKCDVDRVDRLITSGFDINSRDAFGESPAGYAVAFGCLEVLTLLLEKGAKMPEVASRSTGLMLTSAVKTKNTKILSLLLSQGLNPNVSDTNAMTPLMWAITMENAAAVEILLKYGAEVGTADLRGKTALQYATSRRNPIFKELIETA